MTVLIAHGLDFSEIFRLYKFVLKVMILSLMYIVMQNCYTQISCCLLVTLISALEGTQIEFTIYRQNQIVIYIMYTDLKLDFKHSLLQLIASYYRADNKQDSLDNTFN